MTHPRDRLTPLATIHEFGNCGYKFEKHEDRSTTIHFEGELPLSARKYLESPYDDNGRPHRFRLVID